MHKFVEKVDDWKVSDQIEHPRVFLSKAKLSRLRERSTKEGTAWERMLENAESTAREPLKPLGPDDRPAQGVVELAFAYALWEDELFLRALLSRIERAFECENWVWHGHRRTRMDLLSSNTTSAIALAYDWLYETLSDSERTWLIEGLKARDLTWFFEIASRKTEWWTNCRMNWQSVMMSNLGVTILATLDQVPDWREGLKLAIEGVVEVLDEEGEDGSHREGVSYWAYGIGESAWFALALKEATKSLINLFEHPYFDATRNFALYMLTPDGGCFDFEDCHWSSERSWLIALLAREFRDTALQSLVSPPESMNVRFALSYDPSLEARLEEETPTSFFFPCIGTVSMRSDWGERATLLCFHAGKTTVPHSHLDVGSFIIGTRGERLIPDSGVWRYDHYHGFFDTSGPRWDYDANSTIGHNLILVDGEGERFGEEHYGEILSVELGGDVEWVVSDLRRLYAPLLSRFVRYFVFVKADAVVVLDDISSEEPRHFEWLLQFSGELSLNKHRARIRKGDALAELFLHGIQQSEGYRVSLHRRITHYTTAYSDEASREVKFLSFGPIHRQKLWRPKVAILLGDTGDELRGAVEFREAEAQASITLPWRGKQTRIVVDYRTLSISADH